MALVARSKGRGIKGVDGKVAMGEGQWVMANTVVT